MTPTIETLTHGYGLIEGPRVDTEGNLYFSDVLGGGVRRLDPDGEVHLVVPKRRGVGGIALHADGGLVISGRDLSHVIVDGSAIETRTVFETDAPGLNDLFTDTLGRVYCGTIRSDPFSTEGDRMPGECYRIDLDGTSHRLYGDVSLTNGIGFSPDGSRMYHSDTGAHHVIRHDLLGDEPVNRTALHHDPAFFPDGLAVDEAGTIWVADYGSGRVLGIDPDGGEVASIPVPAKAVTSLCFGGEDLRDLYIVTADNTEEPNRKGTVFRTRVDVPGLRTPLARV